MKRYNPKKGEWVFIKSSHLIRQQSFNEKWPRGIFGRIIEITQRYSQFDGRKLPLKLSIRAYMKGGRTHLTTDLSRIIKCSQNN